MRKSLRLVAVVLMLFMAFGVFMSCYGTYTLTHKVHRWNGTLGNKWVKTIVHIIFYFPLPIYEICWLVDFLILNTIEFWVGSNPLAMAPGDKEVQIVESNHEKYQITATMNRFDVVQLTGEKAGQTASLVYDPDTGSWYAESAVQKVHIAEMDKRNPDVLYLLNPDNTYREVRVR
jgi:hypothetical protein